MTVAPPPLDSAACARHRDVDWFSQIAAQREAAVHICRTCPLLEPCRRWVLSLPVAMPVGIFAAMSPAERKAERLGLAGRDRAGVA